MINQKKAGSVCREIWSLRRSRPHRSRSRGRGTIITILSLPNCNCFCGPNHLLSWRGNRDHPLSEYLISQWPINNYHPYFLIPTVLIKTAKPNISWTEFKHTHKQGSVVILQGACDWQLPTNLCCPDEVRRPEDFHLKINILEGEKVTTLHGGRTADFFLQFFLHKRGCSWREKV